MREKGESVTDGMPNPGDKNSPNYKHYTEVGRSAPHHHNQFFIEPRKNKNRMGWATKLMEEKGVVFNDE